MKLQVESQIPFSHKIVIGFLCLLGAISIPFFFWQHLPDRAGINEGEEIEQTDQFDPPPAGMSRINAACLATRNEDEWGMVMDMARRGERADLIRMNQIGLVTSLSAGSIVEKLQYHWSNHTCKIRIPGHLGYWYVPAELVD